MIGRDKELKTLRECVAADRSRLVVVYGRRRVGKTYLVREAFDYRFTFTHTGLEDGDYFEQLNAFWRSLKSQWCEDCKRPTDWMEAFELLKKALSASDDARKTVFIDELPWMDTRNSGFVKAVSAFWNGWASARKDIVMIVCGSAASWMSEKILQNKGGLFNRANKTIFLEPFTLHECETLLEEEGISMDRKDVVSAYMIFGGAPYYWTLIEKGTSLSQNIDRLFFAPNAMLAREFSRLYKSVFANPEPYIDIVAALASKKAGMTRDEILTAVDRLSSGGVFSRCLDNLEVSGFVRRYAETGHAKNGAIFQLIDNLTLFHFAFVKDYTGRDPERWAHLIGDRRRSTWEGLAFERVCLQHSAQIKRALGISGILTAESGWRSRSRGTGKGAQIDLVIERADRVANLCEMKFVSGEYEIDASEAKALRNKMTAFARETGFRGTCHMTFVTTYGVCANKHSGLVQSQVTMDDLFRDA